LRLFSLKRLDHLLVAFEQTKKMAAAGRVELVNAVQQTCRDTVALA
jgi:hypothetical protein